MKLYHGTRQPEKVLEAIIGGDQIRLPFHMTPDPMVAAAYGSGVIEIEFEDDLVNTKVRRINKEGSFLSPGNCNMNVNGTEIVVTDMAAFSEFYNKLYDARRV